MTRFETIITALEELLWQLIPDAKILRNSAIPEQVPVGGLIILRDGNPGEPEEVLGGFGSCYYEHEVDVEIFTAHGDAATRDQRFDALLASVGNALESDPQLGGLVFGIRYARPETTTEPVEGGHDIKLAVLTLIIEYETATPLG